MGGALLSGFIGAWSINVQIDVAWPSDAWLIKGKALHMSFRLKLGLYGPKYKPYLVLYVPKYGCNLGLFGFRSNLLTLVAWAYLTEA